MFPAIQACIATHMYVQCHITLSTKHCYFVCVSCSNGMLYWNVAKSMLSFPVLYTLSFLDSFDYFYGVDGSSGVDIGGIDRTNIAWDTDRNIRFRNPNGNVNITEEDLRGTIRPPNWPLPLNNITGGLTNESFIVWFRVSAFPLFRKLYGRLVINGEEPGQTELPAGNYSLNITYSILDHVPAPFPFHSLSPFLSLSLLLPPSTSFFSQCQ